MRLILALALLMCGSQNIAASTYKEWLAEAVRIIDRFETKKLDHVTDDFDCQGLSLGAQQKPIANGGLGDLVKAIDAGSSAVSFNIARDAARETMPRFSEPFIRVLDLVEDEKFSEARVASLQLQNITHSDLCFGGQTGSGFKSRAKEELAAWLQSDALVVAQTMLKHRDASNALDAAFCWTQSYAEQRPLEFRYFVYHLDFLTNAGGLGIYGGEYYKISNLIRAHEQYGFDKSQRIARKTENLARWMETEWVDPINASHEADARLNAAMLRRGEVQLGYDELQLLYVRMMRAQVGSTPAQMSFFNRGFLLVNGVGWFQSGKTDLRARYDRMGPLSTSDTETIQCE
ncbi:hypothetical protein [uncultured Tateyamaria sp.]|uniref:hypothetical protein n=1 Tax=uncultured Tateyamaria sp. TaxID=455651 RepID=UPI0026110AA6|nr:hypothetical protein [uncultured Tateyamaria sp.]